MIVPCKRHIIAWSTVCADNSLTASRKSLLMHLVGGMLWVLKMHWTHSRAGWRPPACHNTSKLCRGPRISHMLAYMSSCCLLKQMSWLQTLTCTFTIAPVPPFTSASARCIIAVGLVADSKLETRGR